VRSSTLDKDEHRVVDSEGCSPSADRISLDVSPVMTGRLRPGLDEATMNSAGFKLIHSNKLWYEYGRNKFTKLYNTCKIHFGHHLDTSLRCMEKAGRCVVSSFSRVGRELYFDWGDSKIESSCTNKIIYCIELIKSYTVSSHYMKY